MSSPEPMRYQPISDIGIWGLCLARKPIVWGET